GEYLNPGDAVLQVIDVENIEVSAQIQFGDLASIEKSAELWFEHADKAYPVAVRATLNALNSATRDQEMRLNFTEDSALPGAAGQLYWRDKRPHLPGNLLVQRGNELGLFVVENEVAKFVPITDAAPGRAVAVNFPLDTRIVIEGFYSLSDGDTLTSQGRAMR
ncbi:MAG: efflux RND transporter periplasmic adaptor subunit, partial [Pseudomonadota bacterium]